MKLQVLKGKTIFLTGFTSGIGLETARALAGMGAEMILVARNALSGNSIAAEIKRESDNNSITVMQADLSEKEDLEKLNAAVRRRYSKIDVLINNAGQINSVRKINNSGHELTFAVNHLAYFGLTNLLFDLLALAPEGRIINVASDAHRNAKTGLNFKDLMHEEKYSGFTAYSHSKLANILFTRELARRAGPKKITANCLHPGMISSNIARSYPAVLSWLWKMAMRGAKKGADTSVFLASAPEGASETGQYWIKRKIVQPSSAACDQQAAKQLWEISLQLLGMTENQVLRNEASSGAMTRS